MNKTDDLIIVGSGGFAREVRQLINDQKNSGKKYNILGWVSNEPQGTFIDGLKVLGNDEWLLNYSFPVCIVIAIGNGKIRNSVYLKIKNNINFSYPNIIANNSINIDVNKLGKGAIITHNNVFTTNISIGDFFICNLMCTIGHDCIIGDFVTLYPGVCVSGNVKLDDCVSLGTKSCVLENKHIKKNSFIGAGAVVIDDIDENSVAVGIPAKKIKVINN